LISFNHYFVSLTTYLIKKLSEQCIFEWMSATLTRKYFGIAFLLSLVIAITIQFPLVIGVLFEEEGGGGGGHRREAFNAGMEILEFINTFTVTFLLFTLNFYLLKPFARHHKIKLRAVLLAFVLSLISVMILVLIYNIIKPYAGSEINISRHHDKLLFQNLFAAALVFGSIFIIRLIYQKQTYELENEKLRTESLQSQFESLKNQMSPHFLFNTLTALKSLIRESPDLAGQYVNHLALVLRYTLQGNEKKTVTLREEMEYTESYLFLIEMRYGTNLTVKTEIQERFKGMELPPLTIQTLIENAVKHNEISNKNPLEIVIQTPGNGGLTVSNRIQKKLTPEHGTGIGLTNLSKQFQLLGESDIQIAQENNVFCVTIPLIKPAKK
jgi:sensor histidine kinase YesM